MKVCCQEQADERAVVDSVTSERSKKDRLDAGDLPVQVPEILLRECEQEIQRVRAPSMYVTKGKHWPSCNDPGVDSSYIK